MLLDPVLSEVNQVGVAWLLVLPVVHQVLDAFQDHDSVCEFADSQYVCRVQQEHYSLQALVTLEPLELVGSFQLCQVQEEQ